MDRNAGAGFPLSGQSSASEPHGATDTLASPASPRLAVCRASPNGDVAGSTGVCHPSSRVPANGLGDGNGADAGGHTGDGIAGQLIDYWQGQLQAWPPALVWEGLRRLSAEALADLQGGPAQAIQEMRELQGLILNRSRLRLWLMGDRRLLQQARPQVEALVRSFPQRRVEASRVDEMPAVWPRLRTRYPSWRSAILPMWGTSMRFLDRKCGGDGQRANISRPRRISSDRSPGRQIAGWNWTAHLV